MASPASSPARPARRRQRSVRVTVASALIALATVAVALALPTQSPTWLSAASVLALVCGALASRIVYSELVQSRRDAAADRAAQAQAYKTMFTERAAEHAEFTTMMTDRVAGMDREINTLEATIVLAEKRAIEAETRVQRESRRANEAQEKLSELQQALEIRLAAADADSIAAWDGDLDTVVDLLAWEDKVSATATAASDVEPQQKHA
jgi:hypothetical protein